MTPESTQTNSNLGGGGPHCSICQELFLLQKIQRGGWTVQSGSLLNAWSILPVILRLVSCKTTWVVHRTNRGSISTYVPVIIIWSHIQKIFHLRQRQGTPCHTPSICSTYLMPTKINSISVRSEHIQTPISEPSWYSQLDFCIHLSWPCSIIALPLGLQSPYQSGPPQSGPICPPVHSLDFGPRYALFLSIIHRTTCPYPLPVSTQQGSLHRSLCSNIHFPKWTTG